MAKSELVIDTTEAHKALDALVVRIDNITARIDALDERLRPKAVTIQIDNDFISDPSELARSIRDKLKDIER